MITYRKIDFILHLIVILSLLLILCFNLATGGFAILVMQFFIGVYQLLSSIGRTVKYYSFDKKIKQSIIIYWILVAMYGLGWALVIVMDYSRDITMPYIFSAWILAFYYCYITYRLAFPNYTKSHLDI